MTQGTVKEEYVIILDILQNGYPLDPRPSHKKTPIAQAIGKKYFTLLELVPKKEASLKLSDEVYIGEGKRDHIHHILGKITLDKLTQTARGELELQLKDLIKQNESRFVSFFNNASPINSRRHQIELLPGIGNKHMWVILEARNEKQFDSFEDIKKRVSLLPDPEKIIIKRIMLELNNEDKYRLFVGVP